MIFGTPSLSPSSLHLPCRDSRWHPDECVCTLSLVIFDQSESNVKYRTVFFLSNHRMSGRGFIVSKIYRGGSAHKIPAHASKRNEQRTLF